MNAPSTTDNRILLPAPEAARVLSISERTLWAMTQNRGIPHIRIGRRVLYRAEALAKWAAEREKMLFTEE
jgi:excisionase family DNA binding protein